MCSMVLWNLRKEVEPRGDQIWHKKVRRRAAGGLTKFGVLRLWRVIRLNERMSQRLEGVFLGLTCVFTTFLVPLVL